MGSTYRKSDLLLDIAARTGPEATIHLMCVSYPLTEDQRGLTDYIERRTRLFGLVPIEVPGCMTGKEFLEALTNASCGD